MTALKMVHVYMLKIRGFGAVQMVSACMLNIGVFGAIEMVFLTALNSLLLSIHAMTI